MPRLIPRLTNHGGTFQNFPFARSKKKTKSLYKSPLSPPSFHPSQYAQSILLANPSPVADKDAYTRHKRLPPIMTLPHQTDESVADVQRQMTDKEFGWWSNPYLRMLSSPMRTCVVTGQPVPADLLIRLVGMRLPLREGDQSKERPASDITLVPDGLLHSKYVSRKVGGTATYVLCWRNAVKGLHHPAARKRISGKLVLPPSFPDYVAHLLRLRVLQELELLTERLEYAMRSGKSLGNPAVILRRLSYNEWGVLRSNRVIPFQNALAVLVVPQPNRHPVTKERPLPSMSASPPDDEEYPDDLPPLSELIPISTTQLLDETGILPHSHIPLYNSITVFPSRSQRAALYQFLTRILATERFLKRLHVKNSNHLSSDMPDKSSSRKESPAFVLCSNGATIRRGDSAAVALALWRLRMYEAVGWTSCSSHPAK